ncbi:chitosanase of glycosyl hydrolase group 75 [Granulicella rosea]|uniref:Chitosanase of glycosyl hydrolase group 75 n=1 Tax=Granulicella rosea TaxID=474952 RepID=A0A239LTX6_9BACT|nr:glycoside hydrolase family 75 protein [Granulicella rosea]SNT33139.1 chitosanase of glycosyl hydrolase group 75 [Granulicella rosea]
MRAEDWWRLDKVAAMTPLALGLVLGLTALAQGEPPKAARGDEPPPPRAANAKPCPASGEPRRFADGAHPAVEVVVKMDVDVDGAPNAYGPPGKKALDIEKHAHSPKDSEHPGAVVGYMTEYEGGPPTVQGKNDPYPGYYVSQTDFADKDNKRMEDPRRYVDATKINYVVQGRVARTSGVTMGDFATVYSCRTGKSVYAIVADSGNESGAEGSLALVKALGYRANDGIDDSVDDKEIVVRYYPNSNPQKTFFKSQAEIDAAAKKLGLTKY